MFVSVTAKAQPSRLPVYQVGRTSGPIKIDGKLDARVEESSLVGDFVNTSDALKDFTKQRPGCSTMKLYLLAFRCADDNIWSTMKRRDQQPLEEEVVEVFLQADSNQPSYIELEVNPLGAMLDIYLLGVRKPLTTKAGTVKSCAGQCTSMGQ